MRRWCVRSVLICAVVNLLLACGAWGKELTPQEMYLDPAEVPEANYEYPYFSVGHAVVFSNQDGKDVVGLKILPPLLEQSTQYYFTPGTDYTADITNGVGTVTFNRPGPYFVQVVYADNNSNTAQLFDFGIEFEIFNGPQKGPTSNWHKIPTPSPDVVVRDPDLKKEPKYDPKTKVVSDKATWKDVTDYLKTLTNAHVELGGHGSPAAFYYKGEQVLYDCTKATNDWLDSLRGHVSNLTFMSCSTARGDEGKAFIQKVANYLGASAGYTNVVGSNGVDWLINKDGKLIKCVIPEPSAVLLALWAAPTITLIAGRRLHRR
ncbi:MAG: DUF4347 domain-containing protein [Armatimonadota bacterium]|nr:DUF4347 domain-containing protein [Armatimonadota bacterium]